MKAINKILSILILSSIILSFSACSDDDGYSNGEFWVEIGTIEPLNENLSGYHIVLDDGAKLWPVNQESLINPQYSRAQINYTKLSDSYEGYKHMVRVNYVRYILTKNILELTPEINDSIGHDKIKILELWEGDDFINIHFGYNAGGTGILHSINLVEDKSTVGQDGVITLEFRHNQNGDPEKYGVTGIVAFNLRPYKIAGQDSVKFKIKVNSFDEQNEYDFVYKYTDTKKSERAFPEVSTQVTYQ